MPTDTLEFSAHPSYFVLMRDGLGQMDSGGTIDGLKMSLALIERLETALGRDEDGEVPVWVDPLLLRGPKYRPGTDGPLGALHDPAAVLRLKLDRKELAHLKERIEAFGKRVPARLGKSYLATMKALDDAGEPHKEKPAAKPKKAEAAPTLPEEIKKP